MFLLATFTILTTVSSTKMLVVELTQIPYGKKCGGTTWPSLLTTLRTITDDKNIISTFVECAYGHL